jgi:hypothetical protein
MRLAREKAVRLAGGICLGERVRACLLRTATEPAEVD